jgi:PTH1 family peptidyl-tRNA hydrolase
MKMIVGLGNPGKKYLKTRHNIGFMVLDALHDSLSAYNVTPWELSKKFNAMIAGATVRAEKIILVKPMTFMNASGESVQLVGHYYKLTASDMIVVHDDKDIPLGEIKEQQNRSSAGHNGVKSIIEHVGTQDFTRLRIGIASDNPKKMSDIPTFVLKNFGLFERSLVDSVIVSAVKRLHVTLGVGDSP